MASNDNARPPAATPAGLRRCPATSPGSRLAGVGRALLALALVALAVSGCAARPAGRPGTRQVALAAQSYTIDGLDAHDGTIVQYQGQWYLYGTRYGCGFHWRTAGTPFCGFGVWTSSDLTSWTYQGLLFDPATTDSFDHQTWNWACGSGGDGCFNPRMVRRPSDGTWLLWFNAPGDYARTRANAYYVMGCDGPTGPCGDSAGAPDGSTHKPSMYTCYDNGDFSIVAYGSTAYIVCTMANQTLSVETLNSTWTDGTGVGASNLAGLTRVESPAMWVSDGTWILTYSDPNCGYCSGDGTGYATAASPLGPWTAPSNTGFSAPATGRRDISATSCGGQPRTAFFSDGQVYEWIDLWGQWNGDATNQTRAGIHLEPLVPAPPYDKGSDGTLWPGGFMGFSCQ